MVATSSRRYVCVNQRCVNVLEKSIQAYLEIPRVKWVRDWPGQIALAVSQIYWTQGAHEAIWNTQGGHEGVP